MSDLISRQAVIEALKIDCSWDIFDEYGNITEKGQHILETVSRIPSAQPDASLVTWLLDEVWDEDLWELNCRSFPEVLCRRLVRYGYLKVEDGKYVRLDKQTDGNSNSSQSGDRLA